MIRNTLLEKMAGGGIWAEGGQAEQRANVEVRGEEGPGTFKNRTARVAGEREREAAQPDVPFKTSSRARLVRSRRPPQGLWL